MIWLVATPLTPGSYTVLWRTAAADGHPTSGLFTFDVVGAEPARVALAVQPLVVVAHEPPHRSGEAADLVEQPGALVGVPFDHRVLFGAQQAAAEAGRCCETEQIAAGKLRHKRHCIAWRHAMRKRCRLPAACDTASAAR